MDFLTGIHHFFVSGVNGLIVVLENLCIEGQCLVLVALLYLNQKILDRLLGLLHQLVFEDNGGAIDLDRLVNSRILQLVVHEFLV